MSDRWVCLISVMSKQSMSEWVTDECVWLVLWVSEWSISVMSEWSVIVMSKWSMIDCCLTPSEQSFSYIIVRTIFQLYHCENNLSAISLWEQSFSNIIVRTIFQQYHCENNLSAISLWEQSFSYIIVRTSYFIMRCWQCQLYSRWTIVSSIFFLFYS